MSEYEGRFAALLTERDEARAQRDAAVKLANLSKGLLDDANAEARELSDALASIIDDACSYICPSTGREGVPIPHSPRCVAARAALEKARGI